MKFSPQDGSKFDRGDIKGINYTGDKFARMSAAIINVEGKHPKMKSVNSDRLYFILQGKGVFIINDQETNVKTQDVIIVPKNTPYSYSGTMQCFLVHSPAFDRKKEVRYDN